ncbi:ribonuclease H-like isoform X2 [Zophobas morio]|uniref:ribonuclease H-like isoform X2 n=1 Tax=Zophobas morio TaxID=2755281 RepID=UPI003082E638
MNLFLHYPNFEKFTIFGGAESLQRVNLPFLPLTPKNVQKTDSSRPFVAFCDGSALNNGLKNCRAGYACVFPDNERWNIAKAIPQTSVRTINRAETMAAIEAVKRVNLEDPTMKRALLIYTDSNLLVKTFQEWIYGWMKNDWLTTNKQPVKNKDLIDQFLQLKGERKVLWAHVYSHTDATDWKSFWNNKADRLAKAAAHKLNKLKF